MSRCKYPRADLLAWMGTHPEGCTSEAVCKRMECDLRYAWHVLADLRKRSLVRRVGNGRLARWATPATLAATVAWHDHAIQRERRARAEAAATAAKPAPTVFPRVRWIFDLGGLA